MSIPKFNPNYEYCFGVWQPNMRPGDEGSGISADAFYSNKCNDINNTEECNNAIDIIGYNTATDRFGDPDGLSDCFWHTPS